MSFTELNAVEHFIIHQLGGVNLNNPIAEEPKETDGFEWKFKSSTKINRGANEVLIEAELREALIRLNPETATKNELVDKREIIYTRALARCLHN